MSDRPNNDLPPADPQHSGWRVPETASEPESSVPADDSPAISSTYPDPDTGGELALETRADVDSWTPPTMAQGADVAAPVVQAAEANAPVAAVVVGGGWSIPQPSTPGVTVQPAPEAPRVTPRQAWRIPTLPRHLEALPREAGGWRLPERTIYNPDDESVVIAEEPPVEGAVPLTIEEMETILPHDESDVLEESLLPVDYQEGAVEVLPFEDERGAEADSETAEDEDEEDEEGEGESRLSMSQLVALASLEEARIGAVEAGAAPDEAALDPAEYARRQLEALRSGSTGGVLAEPEVDEALDTSVEQGTPPEAAPAVAALNPDEQAEAVMFHDAEAHIRALRDQYRNGQITRDELQTELKKHMVLDANNSYWMMGVESDNWYHHENGAWVQTTPPVLEKEAQIAAAASAAAPAQITAPTREMEEMPLPRQVPTRDLDATIVGTEGMYLDPSMQSTMANAPVDAGVTMPMQATLPSAGVGPTVYNQAIGDYVPPQVEPVPAPYVPPPVATPAVPSYEEVVKQQQGRTIRTVAIIAAIVIGVLLILGAGTVILVASAYNSILDPYQNNINALASYQPAFQTVTVYAADNSVITEIAGTGYRTPVELQQVSPFFVHAILTVEDPTYYENTGFNVGQTAGAVIGNNSSDAPLTITEQVACNLVIGDCSRTSQNNQTITVVSSQIQRQYDPNFILNLYINEIYFGNQSYGVETAGQFYFNTVAVNLNLAQAALLAGLVGAPAAYDPVINRTASFDRMDQVLEMQTVVNGNGCIIFGYAPYNTQPFCVSQADITSPQFSIEKAQVEAADYNPREQDSRYPHFVNFVLAQIEQLYGTSEMFRSGFQIYTTLVPRIQDTAQAALVTGINNVSNMGVNTGAVIVSDPATGAVRAMIGSPDFENDQIQGEINNAFTWQLPGQTIFPVTYTSALSGQNNAQTGVFEYMTAATVLWNVPTTFPTNPPFTPSNVNNQYTGPEAIRYALGNTFNVTATNAYAFIGNSRFVDTANRMGIQFLPNSQFGLQSALGQTNEVRLYDMTVAFGTLANNGVRTPLTSIIRITDSTGQAIAFTQPQSSQQVQPQVAYIMSNILADNQARALVYGPNSGMFLPEYPSSVAAISGGASNGRDLWTMGYSSNAVVGVWVGTANDSPTTANAQQAAVPIWNAIMRSALQGSSPNFAPPNGIFQQQICSNTGAAFDPAQPTTGCGSVRTELFVQSMPPLPAGTGFVQTVNIDTWSGLTANEFCPNNTIQQQYLSIDNPAAIQWLQTPQGQAWAQQNGITGAIMSPPPSACTVNTQNPILAINAPANGQQLIGTTQITGSAQASNFRQYTLEVAPQSSPTNFVLIANPSTTQVNNGVLATWDTTTVANGNYVLRLAVYNTSNGYAYRTVQISVNNPLPTATQTPLPTPTLFPTVPPIIVPTVPIDFTPLPFPTPTIMLGP
jgi:membrane peptidoglycan carboxypeptidase